MKDILLLSRLIPKCIDAEVRSNTINFMNDAAVAWQEHMIAGIESNLGYPIKLINFLPIASFPKHYRKPFIRSMEFAHVESAKDVNVGFNNIAYIKRLIQGRNLYKEVKKWAHANPNNEKHVIIYTLYPEFMNAAKIIKKVNPDIKICAIVLDLPQYNILTKKISISSRMYLKWSKNAAQQKMNYIDSFALLTAEMAEALDIQCPYKVIEGICSEEFPKREERNDGLKYIFYAGTLHERFGVMDLVEAFQRIPNENYRLVICGNGDCYDAIRKIAAHDTRIVFKGQLKRDDALEEMSSATVIVNPRGNTEEFVKYSFPSKNIEALSSGIPFVGYKLAGIPDEYDAYINYPSNESKEALAKVLVDICEDKENIYANKAMQAKDWVMKEKNPRVQAKKILALFDEVSNATR